ncbi:MAG: hypothetical protein QNJ41_10210 [Xenococcaceae cyanobacterium MO_188.B32]|nr:hypothetical protein [Xenococcaceae cyanobacterium MO_188.B32]
MPIFSPPIKQECRKGGTVTPFGYRAGDYVEAEKAGVVYRGWIGGFTNTEKSQKLSVYDLNWKRIGQFSLSKVKLLRRSNKLCIARAARSTSLGYCVEPRDSRELC